MKPKLLKISVQPQQSFSVRHDNVPCFYKEFHFHPEIELVHIIKGTGTQFVGNHLHSFKPGDMIMVGANLPHLWKCDAAYFKAGSSLKAEAYVVHFMQDVFGELFFNIPENARLNKLLKNTQYGLLVKGKTKEKAAALIRLLLKATGADKVIILIQLLNLLATSTELVKLNKAISTANQLAKETERMNSVLQYLLNNFTETIKLEKVAAIANLSKNAFCRYFKNSTKRSFSAFLLELRINHACKLLVETTKAVSDICYESGFNNFSNFNRYFKKVTAYSPLNYRNKYL